MQVHKAAQARGAELDFLEEGVAVRAVPTSLEAISFPSVDYKIDLDGAGGLAPIQVPSCRKHAPRVQSKMTPNVALTAVYAVRELLHAFRHVRSLLRQLCSFGPVRSPSRAATSVCRLIEIGRNNASREYRHRRMVLGRCMVSCGSHTHTHHVPRAA